MWWWLRQKQWPAGLKDQTAVVQWSLYCSSADKEAMELRSAGMMVVKWRAGSVCVGEGRHPVWNKGRWWREQHWRALPYKRVFIFISDQLDLFQRTLNPENPHSQGLPHGQNLCPYPNPGIVLLHFTFVTSLFHVLLWCPYLCIAPIFCIGIFFVMLIDVPSFLSDDQSVLPFFFVSSLSFGLASAQTLTKYSISIIRYLTSYHRI